MVEWRGILKIFSYLCSVIGCKASKPSLAFEAIDDELQATEPMLLLLLARRLLQSFPSQPNPRPGHHQGALPRQARHKRDPPCLPQASQIAVRFQIQGKQREFWLLQAAAAVRCHAQRRHLLSRSESVFAPQSSRLGDGNPRAVSRTGFSIRFARA